MNDKVRNIRIDLIMDNHNPIIDEFNRIWDQLSVCEIDVYHKKGGEFIYYNKNNEWIFYIDNGDEDNDGLYCSKERYLDWISAKLFGNYSTTKTITKIMLEYKLNTILNSEMDYSEDTNLRQIVKSLQGYINSVIMA